MKTFIRVLMGMVIFSLAQGVVCADSGYSFNFVVAQKHEAGGSKTLKSDMTIKNQKWSYQVTMENHSFKDAVQIWRSSMWFSANRTKPGEVTVIGHQEFQRHAGGTTIKSLLNNDKVSFSTDPIMLKTTELADGWSWDSGASSTAKGALRGIWIRVYVGEGKWLPNS